MKGVYNKINTFLIHEVYKYFLKNKRFFFLGLLFLFLSGVLQMALPFFFGKAIDLYTLVIKGDIKSRNTVYLYFFTFIISSVLQVFFSFVRQYYFLLFSEKSIDLIKTDLFKKYLKLPLSFHNNHSPGKLMSFIANDVNALRGLYAEKLSSFIYSVFILVSSVIVLLAINYKLSLILLILFSLSIGLINVFSKKIKHIFKNTQTLYANLYAYIEEGLDRIKTIKTLSTDNQEQTNVKNQIRDIQKKTIKGGLMIAALNISSFSIIMLSIMIIVLYTYIMISKGEIKSVLIIPFFTNIMFIINSMSSISKFIGSLEAARGITSNLIEILKEKEEDYKEDGRAILFEKEIKLCGLDLKYQNDGPVVLKNINLTIKKGEFVAFIGHNGSGKTSISNVLLRLYHPSNGKITMDGIDIKEFNLRKYRNIYSVVDQNIDILDLSISDNILYGHHDSFNYNKLRDIKRFFGIDFGKNTTSSSVGRRGVFLSGGQRQRLAMARAFYRDTDILILDEYSSYLDTETKKKIEAYINLKYLKKKTIILISHEPSLVKKADKIVMLHKGEILDVGTHETLIQKNNQTYKTFLKNAN